MPLRIRTLSITTYALAVDGLLLSRIGTLDLRVPRTRGGVFYPTLLEQYQRSERALIGALAECYIQGVSTRKVGRICEELFGGRVSAETVSRYAGQLDEVREIRAGRRNGRRSMLKRSCK